MAQKIAGYTIDSVVTGTTGKLYFTRKRGRRYVVKEFNNIRFLSQKSRYAIVKFPNLAKTEQQAHTFYDNLRRMAALIRRNCRRDGLINVPLRVFRRDASIYKVSLLVESCGIPYSNLRTKLNHRQMDVFLRSILTQLDKLEQIQFVDLDIKPDNLVIQKKGSYYTACLIDFDTGYTVDHKGPRHEMEYTPEFAAPELLYYQRLLNSDEMEGPDREKKLQEAYQAIRFPADIFSAGCVFVYAFTGEFLCSNETDDYTLPGGKLLDERPLWIPKFHPVWRMIVKEMLRYEPVLRPGARFILQTLDKAKRTGLMQAVNAPFEKAAGYSLTDKEQILSQQTVRMGTYQGENCALWLLDSAWLGEKSGELSAKSLWGRLNIAAQRRLDYMAVVLEEANRCAEETDLIARGWLVQALPVCFCRQEVRQADWGTWEETLPNGTLRSKADAIMLELLKTVEVLHSHGLLQCVMDDDDLWFFRGDDDALHAVLARPQRFILQNNLPRPQDVDARTTLMPVELYSYLSRHDPDDMEFFRSFIGPETDIFVLGLVYHRLLCGQWPQIAGAGYISLGMAGQWGEEGILISSRIDVKRKAVIRKMLAFEPGDRPHNCREAAAMVRTKKIPKASE